MNIFKNKILFKLIASICVFLTLLNFGVSNIVYADENEVWGGILITPITKLLTALADGIITLLHQAVLDQQVSIITVSSSDDWWDDWVGVVLTILLTVAIGALVVALLPFTSTIAAVLVVGAVEVISAAILPGSSGGILANAGTFLVERLENSIFGKDLYLPVFRISPEEIFSNDLMLFDINFFNPMEDVVKEEEKETGIDVKREIAFKYETMHNNGSFCYSSNDAMPLGYIMQQMPKDGDAVKFFDKINEKLKAEGEEPINTLDQENTFLGQGSTQEAAIDYQGAIPMNYLDPNSDGGICGRIEGESIGKGWAEINHENYPYGIHKKLTTITIANEKQVEENGKTSKIRKEYLIRYSTMKNYYGAEPKAGVNVCVEEEIFVIVTTIKDEDYNKLTEKKCSVEYNRQEDDGLNIEKEIETTVIKSTASQLKDTVASWYFTFRNLALLVLMLILIYTGIRIVIGSSAGQKAKYKERLQDWFVAVCLIFIMHYIMVLAMELNSRIIELVDSADGENGWLEVIELSNNQLENVEELENGEERRK